MMPYFQVMLMSANARAPTRSTEGSAGYDLYSIEDNSIKPGHRKIIDSGIALAFPKSHYVRVAPRSGLDVKKGIDVMAGVVDSDYRDSIKVVLINHSEEEYGIKAGDRIAQLILTKIDTPKVDIVEELTKTDRGIDGFGSTGR